MVVMAADGEEGEMTIEEVVKEMRGHLNERQKLEDHLVLTNTWRHLFDADMPCDMFKRRVRAQPGGKELWAEYTQTVRDRREAFKDALRVAVAEKRSVYAVAELWGVKIATERLRQWKIVPWGYTFDVEHLRARGRPGMTIRQLAVATGVSTWCVYNWKRKGKLKDVYRFIRRPAPIGMGFEYVVAEVLRGD
jgi:hypothetical protein